MHYANGREAKLGDLVRGRGYNVKHEIIGKVVNLRPGPSCNLSVAHVDFRSSVHFLAANPQLELQNTDAPFANVKVEASIEYGQTDQFLAIDPESGEVLPPVDPPPVAAVIPISSAPTTAGNADKNATAVAGSATAGNAGTTDAAAESATGS